MGGSAALGRERCGKLHIALLALFVGCWLLPLCMLAMSLAGVVSAPLSVAGRVDMNQKLNYFQPHDGKIFCSNKQRQQQRQQLQQKGATKRGNINR